MKIRVLINLVALLAALCASTGALAQGNITLETRKSNLLELSGKLKERDINDRRQVKEFASRAGIPVRRELPNGRVIEFQRFAPGIGPIIYISNNIDAADTVSTDEVWPGGSAGLGLNGSGMTVGEWDAGAVFAEHPDLYNRVNQVDGATELSNHSTHVAGTLIGSGGGNYPEARGMAYAAQLDAYDWNSDTAEMALAASNGLLVSNHSYGIAAGWLYMGGSPPDTWWWIGGDDLEDSNFGYYDSVSQLWDQISRDAPYYLIVKSAGNDRSDFGPEENEKYTVIDQEGNFLFTSTQPRNPDCAPAGYDCLPTASVAKNILTVGAVEDLIGGYSPLGGPPTVSMTDFSSWGPTDDGRIKPDLVGNGVLLFSTYADSPYWAPAIGTSMAAPNITGSLLLLQEHYQDIHDAPSVMRAATLKALAIHTADETGDADGPDYEYGWGLLNTKTAAQVISEDGNGHQIIENSLSNGGLDSFNFNVSGDNATLTATLVWADPPATPVAPSLDPVDLMLVNDLDLHIYKAPATHKPWVLDPASPASAATRGDNFRDNVEQVYVENASPGVYTLEVSHKGTLLNSLPQDYSLIISEGAGPLTGSDLVIDEDFEGGMPVGWSTTTNTSNDWQVYVPDPSYWATDNNTPGSGKFAMMQFDYTAPTVTSLNTAAYNLATASAVVLRFGSYFHFDFLETVNVDISTNGGSTWPTTVWQQQGGFPVPSTHVVDLSGVAAGQSNFSLRFRFDSESVNQGSLWQVDDVKLEAFGGTPPPDKPGTAHSPSPADGVTGVSTEASLAWTAGTGADTHDVYFGNTVPPAFQGNQVSTSFDPGTLDPGAPYFWRVDEVNEGGTRGGNTWSFTTATPVQTTTIHLANMEASSIPGARGRWTASVLISVVDNTGIPVSGVLAEGTWSDGAKGGISCTTGGSGQCTVQKSSLKSNITSVTFTLDNLARSGMVYDYVANEVSNVIAVPQDAGGGNLLPNASNDSFSTTENTPVSGNVMDNDEQGDAPATVTAYDTSSGQGGAVSMGSDGSFTYTPPGGFTGTDSFSYTITDNNGDSASAMVSVNVNPESGSGLTLSVAPLRIKGIWFTSLSWSGGSGTGEVIIKRDGFEIDGWSPTENDGEFSEEMGKKVSGSYAYEVCEIDGGQCAEDTIQF